MKIPGKVLLFVHIGLAFFLILVIGYLNFNIIHTLFEGEFNQNLASIEISYIQMAKFWKEGGGLWQPLWYLGYPWHVFYTPMLPAIELFLHNFFDFTFAHAYRVITASAYILVPVSLFLFVWQLSKSKVGAFIAALIYSFTPSVISMIFSEVGADTLSNLPEPRRFTILVRWGEGPHTFGLVFLPLFGLFLFKFLENKKFINMLLASVFLGLAALTNALVLWPILLMLIALIFSRLAARSEDVIGHLINIFKVSLLSFGLISFWYNFPFLFTFFREGSGALNNWLVIFPWGLIIVAALIFGIIAIVKKFIGKWEEISFGLFWFLMLFVVVFVYYKSGESHLELVPQVLRFGTEVDMAAGVLIGLILSKIYLWLTHQEGPLKLPSFVLAIVLAIIPSVALIHWSTILMRELPKYSKPYESTGKSIADTAEYKTAQKIQEIEGNGQTRVMAPANYGFWLNYFVDVPQLRGALFQSSTHSWPDHIYYQLTNGQDAQMSLAWLKISNIGTLIYTTAGSGEIYKDYKVPESKFGSVLTKQLEENGDIYFKVPLKNESLAKVVSWPIPGSIKKPFNAIDEEPINSYVNWFEQNADKRLDVKMQNSHNWQIRGELSKGEAILFQHTYDSGWKIKSQKSSQIKGFKKIKDPFDFMVLVPKNEGKFELNLVYGKPIAVYLGYLITIGTLLFLGAKITKITAKLKSQA